MPGLEARVSVILIVNINGMYRVWRGSGNVAGRTAFFILLSAICYLLFLILP